MLKSEFKGKIVFKFDLGLLNAYNSMYFDRNISEKGRYLSCVTNCEFFSSTFRYNLSRKKFQRKKVLSENR